MHRLDARLAWLALGIVCCFAESAMSAPPARRKAAADAGDAQARLPGDLNVVSDVVYKTVDGVNLDLLLLLPKEKKVEKSPLVVYIHGGGWGGGDKYKVLRTDVLSVCRELNSRGIACASIEYRLVDGSGPTVFDAAADCKDAVRFLAQNAARWSLDPERIGTFGSSAGGHLTLVTALGDDADYPCDPAVSGPAVKVRCVAEYFGLVSFYDRSLMTVGNFRRPERLVPLLGGPVEEKMDVAKKLSPLDLLKPTSPPIFIAHGDKDEVIAVENATALRDAAKARGIPVECLISHGAGHGFAGDDADPPVPEISRRTVEFFVKYLTAE
jgi:acetyl esterase/lipase